MNTTPLDRLLDEVRKLLKGKIISEKEVWSMSERIKEIFEREVFAESSVADEVFEYIKMLERERDEWMAGVRNFRCPNCKSVAGPLYPVNLMSAIATLTEALRDLVKQVEDADHWLKLTDAFKRASDAMAKAGVE